MIERNAYYEAATSRNLGLLSEEEQERLRASRVAIAGMGAVGGHYLMALVRMGVGSFSIADPDSFEVANLQRQAGAFCDTLGHNKAAAMAEMARAVNPDVQITVLEEGVTAENVSEFLRGADLALDGIDFFQVDAHRLLVDAARSAGMSTVVSGPIGYGASLHVFGSESPSFDEYFGISADMTRAERIAAFGQGLVPRLPRSGSMDPSRVNFERETGPALISAVMLCAGLVANETLRILLKRGKVQYAPRSAYFDPYAREYVRGSRRRGTWRDRVVRWLAMRRYPSLLRMHRAERGTQR